MKRSALHLLLVLMGAAVGYQIHPASNTNAKPTYGETGLPKNCRALIQANLDGLRAKKYSPAEAFSSIERNCGAQGNNWGN